LLVRFGELARLGMQMIYWQRAVHAFVHAPEITVAHSMLRQCDARSLGIQPPVFALNAPHHKTSVDVQSSALHVPLLLMRTVFLALLPRSCMLRPPPNLQALRAVVRLQSFIFLRACRRWPAVSQSKVKLPCMLRDRAVFFSYSLCASPRMVILFEPFCETVEIIRSQIPPKFPGTSFIYYKSSPSYPVTRFLQ